MFITRLYQQYVAWRQQTFQKRALTPQDIAIFFRQFATLMQAGLSLIHCCDLLEKTQTKIAFRLLIHAIKHDILSGKSLSTSFQCYPNYFDSLTRQLILVGEQTGRLDEMLHAIATHQEKNIQFKQRIKHILFYPCFITITACFMTCGMCIFIIPRFAELFAQSQLSLPWLTRYLFIFSAALKKYLLIIMIFLMSLLYVSYKPFSFRQTILNRCKQLPVIKYYLNAFSQVQFARQLAITFSAGIPITDALSCLATHSTLTLTSILPHIRQNILTGLQLHHALQQTHAFSTFLIHMVKIGEESGKLDQMLHKAADFIESDLNQQLQRFAQLLEPCIMLFFGSFHWHHCDWHVSSYFPTRSYYLNHLE